MTSHKYGDNTFISLKIHVSKSNDDFIILLSEEGIERLVNQINKKYDKLKKEKTPCSYFQYQTLLQS
jgi:hypothetical protein